MSEEGWCVLRCAGRHTLELAERLDGDGLEAWAPAITKRIRRSRWNTSRDVRLPLLASFVFAPRRHLADLFDLTTMPQADFSLFRHLGKIRFVDDSEIDRLKAAEATEAVVAKREYYRQGDKVRVPQGIFGDMAGVVERNDGALILVRFGSRLRVRISALELEPLDVKTSFNHKPISIDCRKAA